MTELDRLRTPDGGWVEPEELHRVLADHGYSAGDRTHFLKSLLTELSAEAARRESGGGALLTEVESILEQEQGKADREPIAKDNL